MQFSFCFEWGKKTTKGSENIHAWAPQCRIHGGGASTALLNWDLGNKEVRLTPWTCCSVPQTILESCCSVAGRIIQVKWASAIREYSFYEGCTNERCTAYARQPFPPLAHPGLWHPEVNDAHAPGHPCDGFKKRPYSICINGDWWATQT